MNGEVASMQWFSGERYPRQTCGRVRPAFTCLAAALVLGIAVAAVPPVPAGGQSVEDFSKLRSQWRDLMDVGEYAEAERLAEQLYRWARGPLADQPKALGSACNALGRVYDCQGR